MPAAGLIWPGATAATIRCMRSGCATTRPVPQARHANGQKLFDITELADDVAIDAVSDGGGALHIRFAPDGHEADV